MLELKFIPTPLGEDAVYVFKPGRGEIFFFREDWRDANYILAAAITYLGRKGHGRRKETDDNEEVWISCKLADFIFEPFPAMTIEDLPPPPPEPEDNNIVRLDVYRERRRRPPPTATAAATPGNSTRS